MSFGAPGCFWLLLLPPLLLVWFLIAEKRGAQKISSIVAPRLKEKLAGNISIARKRFRICMLLLGLTSVIFSLVQPRYGYTMQQAKRKGRDIIVAMDTSKSMLATDLSPNRLTRARMAAQDLIQLAQGDRIGLIAFAGSAFLQAPLTVDHNAVLNSLGEIDTEIIPRGGTNISEAIEVAKEAFGKGESENRALIIFTDGEDLDTSGVEAAEKQNLFKVFTVGTGSPEGALIPLPSNSGSAFVKDPEGNIVKSRLDEDRLRKISEVSGGFYLRLKNGPEDMKRIYEDGLQTLGEQTFNATSSRQPIERYQWPLGIGIFFLALSTLIRERKRDPSALALILLFTFFTQTNSARADEGVELYHNKKYQEAYDHFSKRLEKKKDSASLQFDKGTAAYQLGKYDEALGAFSQAMISRDPNLKLQAEYNLANTLAKRGTLEQKPEQKTTAWEDAIKHYDHVLKSDPAHNDAKFNKTAVEQALKQLKEQEEQKQQQQQKSDQQNKDQQKEDQKGQDQNSQQQNSNEQEQSKNQDSSSGENQEQKNQKENSADSKEKSGEEEQEQASEQEKQEQSSENRQPEKQGQKEQPDSSADAAQKEFSGDIKPAEPGSNQETKAQPMQEEATPDGKMTESQAILLLDSQKDQDQNIILREQKRSGPALKDW